MNSENPQQDSPAQATAPPKTKASSQPAGSKRAKRPKQQQQQQAGAGGSSGGGGGAAGQQKLKIVVRRLPPNIPEDIFWTSTEQWVNDETAGWRSFRRGKVAKSENKESTHSRAYILFKNQGALLDFHRSYDGHLFRDKTGNESVAVVEYAVYQKVPVQRAKLDPKASSIDNDADYLSFLESLKPQPKISVEDHVPLPVNPTAAQAQKLTPLLEHLKARRAAQLAAKGPAAVAAAAAAAAAPLRPSSSKKKKDKGKDSVGAAVQGQGKKKKGGAKSGTATPTGPADSTSIGGASGGKGKKKASAGPSVDGQPKANPPAGGKKSKGAANPSSGTTTPPAGPSRQNSSSIANTLNNSVAHRQAQAAAALVARQAPSGPASVSATPVQGQAGGNARSKRRENRKGGGKGPDEGATVTPPPQNLPGGNVVPPSAKPKITLLQRSEVAPTGSSLSGGPMVGQPPPPAMMGQGGMGRGVNAPPFVPGQQPVGLPNPLQGQVQGRGGFGPGRGGGGRGRGGRGRGG